ncbi:hypothetical protein GW17_00058304 [Ensete ventricosum]|nr:hypothetical protein GW17_00058304 [Ensete ventricosum]
MPYPLLAPLCAVAAAAPAQAVGLAAGGSLAVAPLQARYRQPPLAAWLLAVAPCRLAAAGRAHRRLLPLWMAVPCRGSGRSRHPPCRWSGHALLPLLLIAFAAKTQQEYVEQFCAIQSHHTQFKTNLSHENLGSDTTVWKPQRVNHMRSKN